MHRIDHATATVDHLFTEGDPVGGTPATVVTDDWMNAVQEEVCEVIETAGLTLNKANNTQLLDALVALGVRAASTSQTGVAELATDAETQTGTDTTRTVTPAGLASFPKSLITNGYKKFPGGLILQWGQNTFNTYTAPSTITLPIAFPTAGLVVIASGANSNSISMNAYALGLTTFTGAANISSGGFAAHWLAIGH